MHQLIASTLVALTLALIGITAPPAQAWPCNTLVRPCHGPIHQR